jgi:hypothetical protein
VGDSDRAPARDRELTRDALSEDTAVNVTIITITDPELLAKLAADGQIIFRGPGGERNAPGAYQRATHGRAVRGGAEVAEQRNHARGVLGEGEARRVAMNYIVYWTVVALDELADVWMTAADRNAVTAASDQLEREVAADPTGRGLPRAGDSGYVAVEPPLSIE